jgi:hypothetical protein
MRVFYGRIERHDEWFNYSLRVFNLTISVEHLGVVEHSISPIKGSSDIRQAAA